MFGSVILNLWCVCTVRQAGTVIMHGENLKLIYEGWNFISGNYLFTTDSK